VRRLLLGAGVFLVALAFASQVLVPGYAEDRLRDDLEKSGQVLRVEVSATPAVRLLFGRADRVEVEMGEVRAGQGELADLLARTADTRDLDATATVLRVGPFVARDARMRKRGKRLHGEAEVTSAELTAALPAEVGLRPVESGDGQLVLEATAPVLGQELTVRARLSARRGALVIAPDGLLGGIASLTVFSDPRVRVAGVGARPRPDGFILTADATVGGDHWGNSRRISSSERSEPFGRSFPRAISRSGSVRPPTTSTQSR
jgi:hypothetical protein